MVFVLMVLGIAGSVVGMTQVYVFHFIHAKAEKLIFRVLTNYPTRLLTLCPDTSSGETARSSRHGTRCRKMWVSSFQ